MKVPAPEWATRTGLACEADMDSAEWRDLPAASVPVDLDVPPVVVVERGTLS